MTDLAALSLEEKAAQVLFVRLGSNMPPPVTADDDAQRVAAELDQYSVGGLLVFNGNIDTTPDVLATLQRRSSFPLIVATDMEAGLGQQFAGATVFPHAMAFSQTGPDPAPLVTKAARAAAREALAAGVHMALAPVADIHSNPLNPIISIRAFSSDPLMAADLAAAYVRTCREEGLLTATKHFPGHGRTSEDSHSTLPRVDSTKEELFDSDLMPFHACIQEETASIMLAHVWVPSLDPVRRPATFSAAVVDLLRSELGFSGVIVSDSMRMAAATASSSASSSVEFLRAGGDAVLDPEDTGAAVREITDAVESGALPRGRLDEAVGRIAGLRDFLRARHGSKWFTLQPDARSSREPHGPSHAEIASEVASGAIRILSGAEFVRTMGRSSEAAAVVAIPSTRSAQLTGPFLDAVRQFIPDDLISAFPPEAPGEEEVWASVRQSRRVVVALFVRPAAWHSFGLAPHQHQLVMRLIEARPTIVVALGSPDILSEFPGAAARMCSYSDMPPSQVAVVRALFGALS